MNHRESCGVGKHAQDLLSQDAIGGAERVPTGAQEHDLYRLLFERLVCHLDIAQLVSLRSRLRQTTPVSLLFCGYGFTSTAFSVDYDSIQRSTRINGNIRKPRGNKLTRHKIEKRGTPRGTPSKNQRQNGSVHTQRVHPQFCSEFISLTNFFLL